jgi:uncharacterized protein YbaR (Trm112 family)
MFMELIDTLRCPKPHEESWLVLSTRVVESRHVREGTLGCPVCMAEYPIRDGIADFRSTETADGGVGSVSLGDALPEADYLAAVLDLIDPKGFAVIVGRWCERADALLELADAPPLVLVDPPMGMTMQPGLSGVRCDTELPLAAGAARGVAVDTSDAARVRSAARATRVGGRIVAPAEAPVPDGVRELARDERVWVGTREAMASVPIALHVRRGV